MERATQVDEEVADGVGPLGMSLQGVSGDHGELIACGMVGQARYGSRIVDGDLDLLAGGEGEGCGEREPGQWHRAEPIDDPFELAVRVSRHGPWPSGSLESSRVRGARCGGRV